MIRRPPISTRNDAFFPYTTLFRSLAAFDGLERRLFRPPAGALPLNLLLHCARERRTLAYLSYDSHDYARLPAQALLPRIHSRPPSAGDVVLMHDDNMDTVEVLAELLPEWVRQGYSVQAMTVPSGPRSTSRSEEHTTELQSPMRISYAVFCLKK